MPRVRWGLLGAMPIELGFVVLLVLEVTDHSNVGLPGLWSYPSAWIGDSMLLPTAAGVLAVWSIELGAAPRDRLFSSVGAIVGGCIGATTQAIWLADDAPALNWTLPAPHTFSAAGWVHAVYLSAAAAYLAGLCTLVTVRYRYTIRTQSTKAPQVVTRPSVAILLIALLSYGGLLLSDSATDTLSSRTTLVALGAIVVLSVTFWGFQLGGTAMRLYRPLLASLLAATGVVMLTRADWGASDSSDFVLGLAVVILVSVALAILAMHPPRFSVTVPPPSWSWAAIGGVVTATMATAVWVNYYAQPGERDARNSAWLAGALLVTLIVGFSVAGGVRRLLASIDAVIALALIACASGPLTWLIDLLPNLESDVKSNLLTSLTLGAVTYPVFTHRFDKLIVLENVPGTLTPAQRRDASVSKALLVLIALSLSIVLIRTLFDAVSRANYRDGDGWPKPFVPILVTAGIVILVAAMLIALVKTTGRQRRRLAPLILVAWCIALGASSNFSLLSIDPLAGWPSVAGALLCAWWSAESLLSNCFLLRLRRLDVLGWTTCLLAGVATGLTTFGVNSIGANLADSQSSSLLWFIPVVAPVIYAANGAICVLAGTLAAPPAPDMTNYGVAHNLAQDAAIIGLLGCLVVTTPITVLTRIPVDDGPWTRSISTFGVCFSIFTLVAIGFRWVMGNSIGHIAREISKRAPNVPHMRALVDADRSFARRLSLQITAGRRGLPGDRTERYLRNLAAHSRTQNWLAVAILVPSIVPLISLIFSNPVASGVDVPDRP